MTSDEATRGDQRERIGKLKDLPDEATGEVRERGGASCTVVRQNKFNETYLVQL